MGCFAFSFCGGLWADRVEALTEICVFQVQKLFLEIGLYLCEGFEGLIFGWVWGTQVYGFGGGLEMGSI